MHDLCIFCIDDLVSNSKVAEDSTFTKEELDVPKEPRRYKRKTSLKWKVKIVFVQPSYYIF